MASGAAAMGSGQGPAPTAGSRLRRFLVRAGLPRARTAAPEAPAARAASAGGTARDAIHPRVRAAGGGLAGSPPPERWRDWTEWDARSWPKRRLRRYALIPTVCFNCEAACGLLAFVDQETG